MIHLGKIAVVLSSKLKQEIAAEILTNISTAINDKMLVVKSDLGTTPSGYILATGLHSSLSDLNKHYTVDVYIPDDKGVDKPIGALHVYEDWDLRVFTNARKNAIEAYKEKVGDEEKVASSSKLPDDP